MIELKWIEALIIGVFLSLSAAQETRAQERSGTAISIPEAPYYYLLDEPKALNTETLQHIEALLIEHDKLTGEQFMVAILKNTPKDMGLGTFAHQIFSKWKIGQRGINSGILLLISFNQRKAWLEAGYSFESILTPSQIDSIINTIIDPKKENSEFTEAILKGIYQVLVSINSPLIQNGNALFLIKSIFKNKHPSLQKKGDLTGWFFSFVIGILLLLIVVYFILAREAHFSRLGWYHLPILQSFLLTFYFKYKSKIIYQGGVRGAW